MYEKTRSAMPLGLNQELINQIMNLTIKLKFSECKVSRFRACGKIRSTNPPFFSTNLRRFRNI